MEAQIETTDSNGNITAIGHGLELLDNFFTVAFAVELAINAFAHWLKPFVEDGWNAFDVIVVALSLIALGPINIPLNVLRSLRAFRVVRLFGRMGPLRDIVSSLTAAISPVLNAFFIMLIVGSICAPCKRVVARISRVKNLRHGPIKIMSCAKALSLLIIQLLSYDSPALPTLISAISTSFLAGRCKLLGMFSDSTLFAPCL